MLFNIRYYNDKSHFHLYTYIKTIPFTDVKDGTCPAEFGFLEKKIGDRMSPEGMMEMGKDDDDDMEGERSYEMWDDRGLPERSMEEHNDGGLFDTMRDWLAPTDMEMEMGKEMDMMGMDKSMMGKSCHITVR